MNGGARARSQKAAASAYYHFPQEIRKKKMSQLLLFDPRSIIGKKKKTL